MFTRRCNRDRTRCCGECIESIDLDQTLWQRMMGYGTLTIRGMGSEDLTIFAMQDPVRFQTDARRLISMASGSGRI